MKAHRVNDSQVAIHCPGCNEAHILDVSPGRWTFNGSFEAPTFSPSLLARSGHFAPHFVSGDNCWCTYNADHPDQPSGFACRVCHSFITGGRIQFLGDSTHALANQTVELPAWGGF